MQKHKLVWDTEGKKNINSFATVRRKNQYVLYQTLSVDAN